MKSFKVLILLMSVFVLILVTGCKEAKEAAQGADEIADQVIGKTPIEKKIKLVKLIKYMGQQRNKQIQDEVDKLK